MCERVAQELQEFLNVMKSRTTKKTWKNDEATAEGCGVERV